MGLYMYEPDDRRETYREERRPGEPLGEPGRRYTHEERIERPGPPPAPVRVDPYNYRAVQVTWFVITLIDAMVAIRFVMKLLGASTQAPFVGFVYGLTSPLVSPFRGIFADSGQGFFIFEPASLVAIAVYALLGWAIVAAIRIATAPRRT